MFRQHTREKSLGEGTTPGHTLRSRRLENDSWPVTQDRRRLIWFPATCRLISLVRGAVDSFVLPPAIVRKAVWRD